MILDLNDLLVCPTCHDELVGAEAELRCRSCDRAFPLVRGIPVFLPEGNAVATAPIDHASNAMGAEFTELLARGEEFVLHIGAGGTAQKYRRCVEFEYKIFRHTDVVGDAHLLPFRDGCFDQVFAFNVFEHLREPALAAREIHRVLKPGGGVAIHTAFLQPLHESPHHYYNATEYGVREWFRDFAIERCEVSGNFSPGFMLGFLVATLLETVRESDAPAATLAEVADTTLGQWAEFWRRQAETPPGFNTLLTLPAGLQKRIAAGFELRARKASR